MDSSSNTTFTESSNAQATLNPFAIVIPALALPACILCIPPLISLLTARNFGGTTLVIGVMIVNLQNTINALIWPNEPRDGDWIGKGLCDIEIKLYIAMSVAIVGGIACIFRQLAIILDTDRSTLIPTTAQRYRTLAFEIVLCIGLPAYLMAVHYVVQPERYWLIQITGCRQSFDGSWPTYVLVLMWPLIMTLVAAAYCSVAVLRLIRYRRRVAAILSSSSSMTKARYVRLFALALLFLLVYLPLSIYTLVVNLQYLSKYPYSWARIHPPNWSERIIRQGYDQLYHDQDCWIHIGAGYTLFVFFGLGHEAIMMYRSWLANAGTIRIRSCLYRAQKASPCGTRNSSTHSPLVPLRQIRSAEVTETLTSVPEVLHEPV